MYCPSMSEFAGRTAVITGGSSGIGAAVARDLAQAGAHVVVVGRRAAVADAIVAGIAADGGSAEFVIADIRRGDDIDNVISRATSHTGRIDIAVNSAGVFDRMREFDTYTDDEWDELIATNLTGVFRCMRAEIAAMRGLGGSIVNIGSTVAHRGSHRASPGYVAAKHGVLGLTRQAALDTPTTQVRVNSVSPGPTLTDMAAPLVAEGPEAVRAALTPLNPMGDFIDPARIAAAVHYLCSDDAADITGVDLIIDGGQLARL